MASPTPDLEPSHQIEKGGSSLGNFEDPQPNPKQVLQCGMDDDEEADVDIIGETDADWDYMSG
jgi:hypothetical protein